MVTKLKPLFTGMLLGALLFAGLYGNIFAHEAGHYVAADGFGLNPKTYLFDNGTGTGFSFFKQSFYTTYDNSSGQSAGTDFLIALAGPMVNLLIMLGLMFAYFKISKERQILRLAVLMLLVPSIISVIANLLPIAGTDGGIIWSYLR